jgi:AcrR family transcriptional regulator
MSSLGPKVQVIDERQSRILAAAVEVFSESSFGEATTEEIARRARVSKRDIYSVFPDKHAILIAVVNTVLQNGKESLLRMISDSERAPARLEEELEIVGLGLVREILSPLTGFASRLVFSESFKQPLIGRIYFDNWYNSRIQMVAEVISKHLPKTEGRRARFRDASKASKHFIALIIHAPQFTASIGMTEVWNTKSVQAHVKDGLKCFLLAYAPILGREPSRREVL